MGFLNQAVVEFRHVSWGFLVRWKVGIAASFSCIGSATLRLTWNPRGEAFRKSIPRIQFASPSTKVTNAVAR